MRWGPLLPQPQLLDDRIVAANALTFQVLEVSTAISDEPEESSTRVDVARMLLQVLRQLVDALR